VRVVDYTLLHAVPASARELFAFLPVRCLRNGSAVGPTGRSQRPASIGKPWLCNSTPAEASSAPLPNFVSALHGSCVAALHGPVGATRTRKGRAPQPTSLCLDFETQVLLTQMAATIAASRTLTRAYATAQGYVDSCRSGRNYGET